jgi:hypothetical protein
MSLIGEYLTIHLSERLQTAIRRTLGAWLTAGLLTGCGAQFYSRTERHLACQCPPAQAAWYASQATLAHDVIFSTPTQLHVVQSNPDGLTVTKLTVHVMPTSTAMTEVRVQTETPATAPAQDEQVAEAFVTAFTTQVKGAP